MSIEAPTFPLDFGDSSGFKNVSGVRELVRFHLTNLIFTNKLERFHDADYGVGISKYLFENITDYIKSEIEDEITEQVRKFLKYLNLRSVDVYDSSDNPEISENTIAISISYSVGGTNVADVLNINIATGTDSMDSTISY